MRFHSTISRFVAFLSIFALVLPTFASPIASVSENLRGWVQYLKARPGPYSDLPTAPSLGNQRRDPQHRSGLWSPQALEDMSHSSSELIASIDPSNCATGHTLAVQASPGSALAWEGLWPATDGSVNTANGDKLTQFKLFDWKQRGGLPVDLTLYHNSETNYVCELGHNWTWSFDIYVNASGSTATIHYGNGLSIPYSAVNGAYIAPAGIHDQLVQNQNGTWTLTTKNQIIYQLNAAGFCTSIMDRNGNQITLTLNTNNYVTRVTDATGRYYYFGLNANNQYTSVTDPLGRIWSFSYNSSDELTSITWPELNSTYYTDQFAYDPTTYAITSHTDRRGNVWTASDNSDGSLASETDPLTHIRSYAYGSGATTCTTPLGYTQTDNYSSGSLSSRVDLSGYSESYVYDSSFDIVSKTDKRGKVWTYTYDSNGNELSEKDPNSNTLTWTYNSTNDPLTITNPLSYQTVFTRDGNGNLLTSTDPLSRVTTNTYDSYGELLTTKTPLGNTTTYGYDTNGNLNSVTDPLSDQQTITHDVLGMTTSVTDPLSNKEQVTYDIWERIVTYDHADGTTVSESYDPGSNVIGTADENGHTCSWTYDSAKRLTSYTNGRGDVEHYGFDANDRRTTVTNGNGKTRTLTFTDRGETYTNTLPDGAVETWSYDGNGDVTGYTNPLNHTISYSFDNAGRQTGTSYPTGPSVTYNYDTDDREVSMIDSTGTSSWTYDNADDITGLSTPEGNMTYICDKDGRRISMNESGIGTTSYSYDNAGRLISLTNSHNETTSWVYDLDSRRTKQSVASGSYTVYTYDSRSRQATAIVYGSGGAVVTSEGDSYDGAGNLVSKVVDGTTTNFGYDQADQVTNESSPGYSAGYVYDNNGNRLSKTLNNSTDSYSYDSADKLLSTSTKTYTYDGAGRIIKVVSGSGTSTLSYDYEDRVTSITVPSGTTDTFSYNGMDARVGKTDSTGTYSYKRDGVEVGDDVLNDSAAQYTPAISENRSQVSKFYHADRLGSVTKITNSSMALTDSRQFDAFGMTVSSTGSTPTPFGYAGQESYMEDADTGLTMVGHRFYDSSTGRFITRDPIESDRNFYVYCRNSTQYYVDSDGLQAEHKKDKRPSTKGKHQKGLSRKKKDAQGEDGDKRRNYPKIRGPKTQKPWGRDRPEPGGEERGSRFEVDWNSVGEGAALISGAILIGLAIAFAPEVAIPTIIVATG